MVHIILMDSVTTILSRKIDEEIIIDLAEEVVDLIVVIKVDKDLKKVVLMVMEPEIRVTKEANNITMNQMLIGTIIGNVIKEVTSTIMKDQLKELRPES
eukprot:5990822-Ditylum_brightwellii.AAC.1